ncbi:hypothetical protein ABEB36_009189 [Hypothenemus hampei]|uniref:THAP-type domain-containing protein n=1 Tax=Hypothenemus hampei TaxID=57062 RepID=A0ABD1ETE7_HYPHA
MPACCVPGCKNRASAEVRLFRFPTGEVNAKRRKMWLEFTGKNDLSDNSKICEFHFSEEQFETQRKDGRK